MFCPASRSTPRVPATYPRARVRVPAFHCHPAPKHQNERAPQRTPASPLSKLKTHHSKIAPQISGYVAFVCPRYCGLNPYSTTCPLPCFTSTSAALPFSFEPPSSQPESSGLPVAGYVATAVAKEGSVIS